MIEIKTYLKLNLKITTSCAGGQQSTIFSYNTCFLSMSSKLTRKVKLIPKRTDFITMDKHTLQGITSIHGEHAYYHVMTEVIIVKQQIRTS